MSHSKFCENRMVVCHFCLMILEPYVLYFRNTLDKNEDSLNKLI